MARTKLSDSNFSLIPEGVTTFKVMEVDDSKYEDFGKLTVKLQTAKGETHLETFSLMTNDGDLNEGALRAWSYFARTCLNNYQVDEIDTQDIVDCYITATVRHETYTRTRGERAGTEGKAARLSDYTPASGFKSSGKASKASKGKGPAAGAMNEPEEDVDLDEFLND